MAGASGLGVQVAVQGGQASGQYTSASNQSLVQDFLPGYDVGGTQSFSPALTTTASPTQGLTPVLSASESQSPPGSSGAVAVPGATAAPLSSSTLMLLLILGGSALLLTGGGGGKK
jgi:hypothetical protein